jgi:hypothetical protein
MGGGGGGGGGSSLNESPKDVIRKLEAAKATARNDKYEAATASYLGDLLSRLNARDPKVVRGHLDEIREALGKDIEGTVDLEMAGSVAKHTYIDGFSDVDCLVKLDKCELADRTPEAAKDYLYERLKDRFPRTEIKAGNLAVTVSFKDAEIQLLPAVSCKGAVRISDESGQRWSRIDPDGFAKALTRINSDKAGKVVPTIKLAKAVIATLPEKQQITGYHAESLAVKIFRDYDGALNTKEMLKHFFAQGSKAVLNPIKDRSGQSIHVDDYLGSAESVQRHVISDTFGRLSRKMESADSSENVDRWHDLFSE